MLAVEGLCKRLGGRQIVDQVSFECGDRQIVVVTGPNGAGKTTLQRIVAGVIEPDRGVVELDGESIVGRRVAARRQLGYVPEAADPPAHLTVAELLGLVASLKRAPALTAELRQRLGVIELADKRIEGLSLGERRRACVAAALIGDPRLLILDEPSNGLDREGVATLIELLLDQREQGAAIVVTTHDRELAEAIADVRLTMRAGKIIE